MLRLEQNLHSKQQKRFWSMTKGVPFNKMSQVIKRLYSKCKITPVFTATQARRAFETFYSIAPEDKQECIANYMCHSKIMADERYRGDNYSSAIKACRMLEKAIESGHTRQRFFYCKFISFKSRQCNTWLKHSPR